MNNPVHVNIKFLMSAILIFLQAPASVRGSAAFDDGRGRPDVRPGESAGATAAVAVAAPAAAASAHLPVRGPTISPAVSDGPDARPHPRRRQ